MVSSGWWCIIRFDGRSNFHIFGTCPSEVADNLVYNVWFRIVSTLSWEIFVHILVDVLSFVQIFAAFWWHILMLWRLVRSGWIDYPVLTWSRLWPILLVRIGCRVGWFSFSTLLLPPLWWDAVAQFEVQGFLGFFHVRMPLFYLVAFATPIASKPVHSTDLVDASESCWGGKKNCGHQENGHHQRR